MMNVDDDIAWLCLHMYIHPTLSIAIKILVNFHTFKGNKLHHIRRKSEKNRSFSSLDHLFFECHFSVMCWQYLYPCWSPPVAQFRQTPVLEFIIGLKQAINQPFSFEVIMLVCWADRNDFLFKDSSPNL
jgi:hypothetical protein